MNKKIFFLLKISLAGLAAVFLLACIVPIRSKAVTDIILWPIKKRLNNKIEFTRSRIWLPGSLTLTDMSVLDSKGKLYYCEVADVRYNIFGVLFKNGKFSFELKKPRFYRDIGILSSVVDMLALSKMPDVEFTGIEGTVRLHKNATYIEELYAFNDSMRIRGNGWISKDGSLDCEIRFSFHKDIIDKVPNAVRSLLLTPEEGGWMRISFKVKGNYKKPSLHIISDRIRLNILEGIF